MRILVALVLLGILHCASCDQEQEAKKAAVEAFNNRHLLCKNNLAFANAVFEPFQKMCQVEHVHVSAHGFVRHIEDNCDDLKTALNVYKTVGAAVKGHTKSMIKMECQHYQFQAVHNDIHGN